MLSALWWLPVAVAAAAVAPLWLGARRLLGEVARLQASTAQLALVRPQVQQVTAEMAAVRATYSTRAAPAAAPGSRDMHDLGPR